MGITSAVHDLQQASAAFARAYQQSPAGEAEPTGDGQPTESGEDVIDAEYEKKA